MENQNFKRQSLEQIGIFLEYPADDFRQRLVLLADQVNPLSEQASNYLKGFIEKMKRMDLAMWQEYYVQTFDLMPQCSLYISVHLFGEESFKRAELMAGLKGIYDNRGVTTMAELPDHLAVVLRHNAVLDDEEWAEFVTMCLMPALPIMIKKLEKNANPYSLVLKSIQELLVGVEKAHV